jgi:hypothetical protein
MKLLNGVEIDGKDYDCSLVFPNNTVVSFMYIPAFIPPSPNDSIVGLGD